MRIARHRVLQVDAGLGVLLQTVLEQTKVVRRIGPAGLKLGRLEENLASGIGS